MDELAFIVLATLMLAISTCTRPKSARCPDGWLADGVGIADSPYRRRGEFSCRYFPWSESSRAVVDYPVRLRGRIYCDGMTRPIAVDDQLVSCRSY